MKSTAVISTSIQDVIITEDRVSTQDGIQLTECKAVLSYQIRMENVSKMLILDVSNYRTIIQDWAKRTMSEHSHNGGVFFFFVHLLLTGCCCCLCLCLPLFEVA